MFSKQKIKRMRLNFNQLEGEKTQLYGQHHTNPLTVSIVFRAKSEQI